MPTNRSRRPTARSTFPKTSTPSTTSRSVSSGSSAPTATCSRSTTPSATTWITSRPRTPLAAAGHEDLAERIRDDLLHHGVIDGDRWSYDVLESFETTFLEPVTDFEADARDAVSDGRRHVRERRQRRRWQERSDEIDRPPR
jgi:hypothetical protein